ncbi:MAG: CotH kinase family protein [Bacteroidota bacterium]
MKICGFLLLCFACFPLWGQVPDSSRLPLIEISSPTPVVNEPKIMADMCIRFSGTGKWTYADQPCNAYEGKVGIEIRGSSSQFFDKKSYGIETRNEDGSNNNVSLLGLPDENDWVLHGPYSDKTLIRNALTYEIGRSMGRWAPRTRLVELSVNGDYKGVYVLMEKIKRDKNRVNIAELDDTMGDPQSNTGGYLLKIDKTTGASPAYAWEGEFGDLFQLEYPRAGASTSDQYTYIRNYVTAFEESLRTLQFTDTDSNGYAHYIEPMSFVDFLIVNELAKNVDGYRLSTWLYKDREGRGDSRLQMGPLWDFNLSFGNANYCVGGGANGWVLNFNRVCAQDAWVINNWWDRLLSDANFQRLLIERWRELRKDELSEAVVIGHIDRMVTEIGPAANRNFSRWGTLGQYVWPNYYVGDTYLQEINYLKNWVRERLRWIDENIDDISYQVDGAFSYGSTVYAYPNPFSDRLNLNMQFNSVGTVQMFVRNAKGQQVFATDLEVPRATFWSWEWDGHDQDGNPLPSGLYFLSLQRNDKILQIRKLIKQ